MKIQGYCLPLVNTPDAHSLYPHQAALLERWDIHDAFELVTKTGTGKTRAVALPILRRRESAVFVYPTNALIADQSRSIQRLMQDEHIFYREVTPDNVNEPFGSEEYLLVQINADTLSRFCQIWGLKTKGEALKQLLTGDKHRIVLVNPDVLYHLFALKYRDSVASIAYLQNYRTAVFDEFHLYNGVELAHAMFMIFLARKVGVFSRTVLLSATPNAEVQKYLDAVLHPEVITQSVTVNYTHSESRTVAHNVELEFLPTAPDRDELIETARAKVLDLLPELRSLQTAKAESNAQGEYIPCVVILNSVVNAIALEDALVKAGIDRTDIASIRGLSARSARDVRGKLLVIGTSAIEVGIDFQVSYLLFEAGDAASFMQRFGRIGRHFPGTAFLLCSHREKTALQSLGAEVSREMLEQRVTTIYRHQDARAWFVVTFGGMVSVSAQVHNFKHIILKDRSADDAMKEQIEQRMDTELSEYARCLGIERILRQVRPKLKRDWFAHYAEIDSFRTSLPSQEVYDLAEKDRGRDEWNYKVDVATLLKRAERLDFRNNRLYVRGYQARHQVYFAKSFMELSDTEVGSIETTADYGSEDMQFYQDKHLTPVSHVMHSPQHHIFVVVPKELIEELDWRIAWFRCGEKGRYIIAFDGAALLLKEIYDRTN